MNQGSAGRISKESGGCGSKMKSMEDRMAFSLRGDMNTRFARRRSLYTRCYASFCVLSMIVYHFACCGATFQIRRGSRQPIVPKEEEDGVSRS